MNFQTGKNRHLGKVPDATGGALQNSVGGVGGWGRVFLRGEAKNEYIPLKFNITLPDLNKKELEK